MYTIGLDVHARKIAVCILDQNGKRFKEMTLTSDVEKLARELERLKKPCRICYEASCGYGHLFDQLTRLPRVKRIAVAHPGRLRLIFLSKRKNDRVDAHKLATLLFLDQVPEVYIPDIDVRAWRAAIEFRRKLVDRQTAVKNELRALLRSYGIATPYRQRLWTRKGLTWLAELELPTPLARLQRQCLLDELDGCRLRLKELERDLDRIGNAYPGVQLLRTIPGVGPRTSEAVMAYIADPKRFQRGKQVGCYFGLVPCQDQSAGANRLGHITREGPATVRKLLTEVTWQGIQRSPEIRAFFERVQRQDPGRKKIALVATAHWLVRVMWSMLRSGEESRFTRLTRKQEEAARSQAAPAASTKKRSKAPSAA